MGSDKVVLGRSIYNTDSSNSEELNITGHYIKDSWPT